MNPYSVVPVPLSKKSLATTTGVKPGTARELSRCSAELAPDEGIE
jgi:hypothetical protein